MGRWGSAGDPPAVIHVGVVGDRPGGMAQVINEYLSWDIPGLRVTALASTRGKRDPLAALLWLRAAATFVLLRVRRTRPALVVHLSQGGAFVREGALVLLARALGLTVAVHLHGSGFLEFAAKRPRLVSRVCRAARTVFVLTVDARAVVERLVAGPGAPRVLIVANAVAVPEALPEKRRDILFAGEAGTRKGMDVLLAAWTAVRADLPGWRLLIAGPPADGFADRLRAAADESTLVLGALPRDEVLALAGTSRIAVLPSRNEALPMFLLEAMARGCAAIATSVGQIDVLLEGGCGILVPVGDRDRLAAALRDLALDEELLARTASAGRERVRASYSTTSGAGSLVGEWRSLAALARAHRRRTNR
jgi:glycosyltransferase involved in cell wall biosynthesis